MLQRLPAPHPLVVSLSLLTFVACSDLSEQDPTPTTGAGADMTAVTGDDMGGGDSGGGTQVEDGPGYVQIVTGETYSCALHESGTSTCWGSLREYDMGDDPIEVASLISGSPLCALTPQGKADCSGTSHDPPDSLKDVTFKTLATGNGFSCGILDADGSIECWGTNAWKQATPPTEGVYTHIAASNISACAIKDDGDVICWGAYINESLDGVTVSSPDGGKFSQLAVGGWGYGCGIEKDTQEVSCWGTGKYRPEASPLADQKVKKISMNDYLLCGITLDDRLVCGNTNRNINMSDFESFEPIDLAAGGGHVCALDRSGAVSCWGNDSKGQASVPFIARPK